MDRWIVWRAGAVLPLTISLLGCQTMRRALVGPSEAEVAAAVVIQPLANRMIEVPSVAKGRSGYFMHRPTLMTFHEEAAGVSDPEAAFQLCDRVKIERLVRYTFPDARDTNVLIEVSQGKHRYFVSHIGPYSVSDSSVKEIADWLTKSPVVRGGVVRLKAGSQSRRALVCEQRTVFTGMTSGEFILARGLPQRVNRTVVQHGQREQWVFGLREYYYFQDGILMSWQD